MGPRTSEAAPSPPSSVREKSKINVWILPIPSEGQARGGMGTNRKGIRIVMERSEIEPTKKEPVAVVCFLGVFPKE